MAERRMFAKTITDSDAFLDMPISAQLLYFHLSMRADDEGFVNSPKRIARMVGASESDLDVLTERRFILTFDSGVVCIKHWKINNYIQSDRFHPTKYTEERALIEVKENGAYTLISRMDTGCIQDVYSLDTGCIQDGYNLDTEVRLGKVSIGKVSLGKSESDTCTYARGKYSNVYLTDEQYESLKDRYPDVDKRIDRLSTYMKTKGKSYADHYAVIVEWAEEDRNAVVVPQKQTSENPFLRIAKDEGVM